MAYIVLALGAFLSIGGAISIFYGASIVEVERGWTGVIAGSTSLTGGIITIALGLILKTLLDLRRASPSAIVAPARSVPPPVVDVPEPLMAPLVTAPAVAEDPADFDQGLLAAFLAPKDDAGPQHTGHPSDGAHAASEPEAGAEPMAAAPVAEDRPEPASHPDFEQAPQPVLDSSRFRVSFKKPPAPPPAPEHIEEPAVPAMDDWLDRAFSDLDNEKHASEARQPVEPDALPPETAFAHAEVAPAEPHHAGAAESAPVSEPEPQHEPERPLELEPPTSAVIGRYEADGTSYIMFADGSIEAQSETGVYRFSSMTELKAYIEGTS